MGGRFNRSVVSGETRPRTRPRTRHSPRVPSQRPGLPFGQGRTALRAGVFGFRRPSGRTPFGRALEELQMGVAEGRGQRWAVGQRCELRAGSARGWSRGADPSAGPEGARSWGGWASAGGAGRRPRGAEGPKISGGGQSRVYGAAVSTRWGIRAEGGAGRRTQPRRRGAISCAAGGRGRKAGAPRGGRRDAAGLVAWVRALNAKAQMPFRSGLPMWTLTGARKWRLLAFYRRFSAGAQCLLRAELDPTVGPG